MTTSITMPRRLTNPFASTAPSSSPATTEKSTRPSKFAQYFYSPRSKSDSQTATSALLAAAAAQQQALLNAPSPQISTPSLSLPTISLSTATADSTNKDEPATTLFSPAEARRVARQQAQFGALISQTHKYSSKHAGGELEDPIVDEVS